MANLYLVPSFLAPDSQEHIPILVIETIRKTRVFVVERTKTARRFIRSLIKDFPIDETTFLELDKHNIDSSLEEVSKMLSTKVDIGLMSEAGTPCIADPGARVVNLARERGYIIRPLTGPSSIILGLMASGMNGQEFTFHGYLPIKGGKLVSKLKEISKMAMKEGSTHLFIETPYRNDQLIGHIIKYVDQSLYLSVATDLNSKDEKIITQKVTQWSNKTIGKIPAIFSIGYLQE